MTSGERALLHYLFLAGKAEQKQQIPGRDRLLVLAMHEAGDAGLLAIAEVCFEKIRAASPHHLLKQFPDAAAALRDENVRTLDRQLRRSCSTERAEMLALNLKFDAESFLSGCQEDWNTVASSLLPQ